MSIKYLTPQDYKTAAKNGITEKALYLRYYTKGMSKKEAITKPPKIQKNRPRRALWWEYAAVCVVSRELFNYRVKRGMEPLEAATKPARGWGNNG